MEAPEKIYIQPNIGGRELIKAWFPVKIDQESIEYVRKDAFIDTIDAKEVDLEKEIDSQWKDCAPVDEGMGCEFANISIEQFANIAKHFFELGIKASQKGE